MKVTGNIKPWQGCKITRTLIPCWQKCILVQTLWKNIQQFPMKQNTQLLFDPTVPLLDIRPREMKIYIHKKTCTKCTQQLYLQWLKTVKNPNVHQHEKQIVLFYTINYYSPIKSNNVLINTDRYYDKHKSTHYTVPFT